MRLISNSAMLALAFAGSSGCDAPEVSRDTADAPEMQQETTTPYKPVASVVDLMRSIITVSAETYWESVSIIVDENGITENAPEGDEEWLSVWAAGISLAESGNLLMMPPRAIDEPDWLRYSEDLVDVGLQAAQAAQDRNFEAVLEVGEYIYNVCLACHREFVPALPDL